MDTGSLYNIFRKAAGISIDTRSIRKGEIFFAIRGENFDGNNYALKAIEAGALLAVADDEKLRGKEGVVLVDDALVALQELAAFHRQQFKGQVIAITGSNGKTTTKELCQAVLSSHFSSFSTVGNLNNHIGVPLTLLRIPAEADFAIVELGDNHPGEIAALAEMVQPDFGVVTNVGLDHLEGFGSPEAVFAARQELFDHLAAHGAAAFVHSDLDYLLKMSSDIGTRITYGSNEHAQYRYELTGADPYVKFRSPAPVPFEVNTRLIGRYNFPNLMMAATAGRYFQVPIQKIQSALESYVPSNNRSQVLDYFGNKLLLDAYNANPSNVEAAIENFALLKAEHKMLILGEMYELGSYAGPEHRRIAELAASKDFDQVLTVGARYELLARELGFRHFSNASELKTWLGKNRPTDYWILLKGSRALALEKILS